MPFYLLFFGFFSSQFVRKRVSLSLCQKWCCVNYLLSVRTAKSRPSLTCSFGCSKTKHSKLTKSTLSSARKVLTCQSVGMQGRDTHTHTHTHTQYQKPPLSFSLPLSLFLPLSLSLSF